MLVKMSDPISSAWTSEADSLTAIAKQKLTRLQKTGPAIQEKVAPGSQRLELPPNFASILKTEIQHQMGELTNQTVGLLDRSADFRLRCKSIEDMNSVERVFFLIGTLRRLHDESSISGIPQVQWMRDEGIEILAVDGLSEVGIKMFGRTSYCALNPLSIPRVSI